MVVGGKKTCARCRESKPVSAFDRKKGRDGYACQCKPCRKITRAAAYKNHIVYKPLARKRCVRCRKTKRSAAFYRCTSARAGLSSQCRKCNATRLKERYPLRAELLRARVRAHQKKNPAKVRAWSKRWRKANRDRMLSYERTRYKKLYPTRGHLIRAKRQLRIARERNLPATLTDREWMAIVTAFDGRCAYCDNPWQDIEHLVPVARGGGLTKENVVPACGGCNKSKGARPFEDFCAERGLDPAAIRARAAAAFPAGAVAA